MSGRSLPYNLRFPGQYYQAETGLNYNYFRDYDGSTGRYIQSDPLGIMGGSFSTFAYVGANPINAIDPYGLWSSGAHNTIIEEYGRQMGLPPDIIEAMEQGSYDADHGPHYQDAAHAFMHAMSSRKLTKEQACRKMNKFVSSSLAAAAKFAAEGRDTDAANALGFGLHAIMDSTSPVHAGFQQWHWWDFWEHGPFPTSQEDVNSLTPELLQQTVEAMRDAVNGQTLDCSCYGK